MTGRHQRPAAPGHPITRGRRARWLALVAVGAAITAAALAGGSGRRFAAPPAPARGPASLAAAAGSTASAAASTTPAQPAARTGPVRIPAIAGGAVGPAHPGQPAVRSDPAPTALVIPAIGVDTSLQPLGLDGDGSLQQPDRWDRAGWYADGVRPGEPGPAVIVGHVDSIHGPAVFYRLGDLRSGDVVLIHAGNTVLRFRVDAVQSYPKASFPTGAVYGPVPLPELRLITCTGTFDEATHNYLDNLIVTAHLA